MQSRNKSDQIPKKEWMAVKMRVAHFNDVVMESECPVLLVPDVWTEKDVYKYLLDCLVQHNQELDLFC